MPEQVLAYVRVEGWPTAMRLPAAVLPLSLTNRALWVEGTFGAVLAFGVVAAFLVADKRAALRVSLFIAAGAAFATVAADWFMFGAALPRAWSLGHEEILGVQAGLLILGGLIAWGGLALGNVGSERCAGATRLATSRWTT